VRGQQNAISMLQVEQESDSGLIFHLGPAPRYGILLPERITRLGT
jgi:hypothetical protein